MFICPHCNREFIKEKGVQVHIRLAHQNEPATLVRKVKELANEIGNLGKLKELVEVLE